VLPLDKKVILIRGASKTPNNQTEKTAFKTRQLQKIFEGIEDELAIITATAKYNHTTCKTDTNQLNLTLAYVEDTEKLVKVIKSRINLLVQATS
jgi:hypothetical protein